MAKVKIRYKRISAFVAEMTAALAPLVPVHARLKFVGATAIDKEGKLAVGGKADADVIALAGGAPVSIEAGWESERANEGRSDLEIEIEFGPPEQAP